MLLDLKQIALEWAYPTGVSPTRVEVLPIPEEIANVAETIPNINGFDTLQGTANLWFSMTKLPKPFPSLQRLIPAIYAFWNAVKGGSDTTTKLMDDCLIQIPKRHMNTKTVAISRCISLILVLNHRLMQVISCQRDNPDDYPSLVHYRHAASARLTYHRTLLRHWKILSRLPEREQLVQNPDPPVLSTPP